MRRSIQAVAAITLLLAIVVGCTEAAMSGASVTLSNTECPVTGQPASRDVTTEWDGKTVGFCCSDCLPEWETLSDEQKAEKLASKPSDSGGAMHGHGHE